MAMHVMPPQAGIQYSAFCNTVTTFGSLPDDVAEGKLEEEGVKLDSRLELELESESSEHACSEEEEPDGAATNQNHIDRGVEMLRAQAAQGLPVLVQPWADYSMKTVSTFNTIPDIDEDQGKLQQESEDTEGASSLESDLTIPLPPGIHTSSSAFGYSTDAVHRDRKRLNDREEAEGRFLHLAESPSALSPTEEFMLCFKDDLLEGRQLYVNQLNNIFKFRSGGHQLNYKKGRFNKLSDFIRSIPHVEIVGVPPKDVVRLTNQSGFLRYVADLTMPSTMTAAAAAASNMQAVVSSSDDMGAAVACYQKQPPIPRIVLERIRELFAANVGSELSATELLEMYARQYHPSKLHCQKLGYPSVHAVLSQVPFVEKVGGRRRARYILKEVNDEVLAA
jgi:hypothetical protein